ncbi:MAG: class I SAM-dependent methyltransferase [Proteobacteria bacterium]|nr:class I SAM-dependent methyltransferase [Pseudomonadota bacterium]
MRQSNQNIEYKSQAIVGYFAENRCSLSDFYPSERKVFEYLAHMRGNSLGNVLDVGCATGGLGRALSERYDVKKYTGVEIHKGAADYASKADYPFPSHILHGDIMSLPELSGKFDSVFALSCADWNVDTWGIILACWNRVSPGGTLLISQRITAKKSIIDAELSYQGELCGT